jgi:magnesium chelatase accessory protein
MVDAAGLRWHVQTLGAGPALLLLHGSGAATHSWRDVAPLLAERFTVVAPDLPGHGFTTRPPAARFTLDGIAADLRALLDALGVEPAGIVGHSAGGALALRMAAARAPRAVVGINAALTPPNALLSAVTPAVHALVTSPFVGALTAALAGSDRVFDALMRSTGSRVAPAQLALYRAFARSRAHTGAVMTMFAGWDLAALERALPGIQVPVTLVVGDRDGWVPPAEAERVARRLPRARVVTIAGTGHLTHEEQPARTAEIVAAALADAPA